MIEMTNYVVILSGPQRRSEMTLRAVILSGARSNERAESKDPYRLSRSAADARHSHDTFKTSEFPPGPLLALLSK